MLSKPATGVKRSRGVAFGSGAGDEDDSYGMLEDYVVSEADPRKGMLFEIAGDSDEEDLPYVMGRCLCAHLPCPVLPCSSPWPLIHSCMLSSQVIQTQYAYASSCMAASKQQSQANIWTEGFSRLAVVDQV